MKLSRKDKNNKILREFEKLSQDVFIFNVHQKNSVGRLHKTTTSLVSGNYAHGILTDSLSVKSDKA